MPCTKPDVRRDSLTCSSALSNLDECFVAAEVSRCDVRDARGVTYAGEFAAFPASSYCTTLFPVPSQFLCRSFLPPSEIYATGTSTVSCLLV